MIKQTKSKIHIMKTKSLALAIVAFVVSIAASAQCQLNYEPYPYGFVGIQGGAQLSFTNYNYGKLITPIGGLQVGGQFSPIIGTRLSLQGINSRTAAGKSYKPAGETDFKYFTGNIDLLVNLTNIFRKQSCCPHLLDLYLVAGAGLNYVWDMDPLPADYLDPNGAVRRPSRVFEWTDDRFSHNFRLGFMLEANVAKHWGVNLEVDMNNLNDRYNAKRGHKHDYQMTAMVGLRYKFGFKKRAVAAPVVIPEPKPLPEINPIPDPEPVIIPEPEPEPEPVIVPEPEPEPVVVPEPVFVPEENVIDLFFQLNKTEITEADAARLRTMGQWLAQHENAVVVVTGYADKGTGNAKRNMSLSQTRAQNVTERLVSEYGFPRDKITVIAKGDTEQPYAENDKNRLVRIQARTVEQ